MDRVTSMVSGEYSTPPTTVGSAGHLAGRSVRQVKSIPDVRAFFSSLKRALPNPALFPSLVKLKSTQLLNNAHRPDPQMYIERQVLTQMKNLVELTHKASVNYEDRGGLLAKIVLGLKPISDDEGKAMFSLCAKQLLATQVAGYSVLSLGSDPRQYAAFDRAAGPELKRELTATIKVLIGTGAQLIGARQFARYDNTPGKLKALAMIPATSVLVATEKASSAHMTDEGGQAPVLRSPRVGGRPRRPEPINMDGEFKRRNMDGEHKRRGMYLEDLIPSSNHPFNPQYRFV